MQELPRERLGVGAQALGAIEGALALTLEYVSQREAFGQRIADFQNTRFTLAQIKAQLEMARAYFDQCVERYFGGYGYTQEYPISRFYLDARVQTIYAGSSEIMKEVIARSLLGKAP